LLKVDNKDDDNNNQFYRYPAENLEVNVHVH